MSYSRKSILKFLRAGLFAMGFVALSAFCGDPSSKASFPPKSEQSKATHSKATQSKYLIQDFSKGDILTVTTTYQGCFHSTQMRISAEHLGDGLEVKLVEGFDTSGTYYAPLKFIEVIANYEVHVSHAVFGGLGTDAKHEFILNGEYRFYSGVIPEENRADFYRGVAELTGR